MSTAIITLTTDFASGSPYVAQMRASVLTIVRQVQIVDICHDVPPQDVLAGALVLEANCYHFPAGTIHVAVVDPGVGTVRRLLAVACEGHTFIGPDNGLLERVLHGRSVDEIVQITEQRFWRNEQSSTFHGRDIMAPVAAHVACGIGLQQLGLPVQRSTLVPLDYPEPVEQQGELSGECLWIDSFGNIISNIDGQRLAQLLRPDVSSCEVCIAGRTIAGLTATYGDNVAGELVALVGSHGRLEIAAVGGNAARQLGVERGSPIFVRRLAAAGN